MTTPRRTTRSRGLPTPTTNDSPASPELKDEPGLATPESMDMDNSPSRNRKRAGGYPSPPLSVLTPVSLERPAKRQVLEAVMIPTRRSKLSSEKTTSADNLTLDARPAAKTEVKDEGDGGDTTESEPDRPTKNDSSADEKPLAARRRPRAAKARAGSSAKRAISVSSASDDDDDMDYALNSDDEGEQLQRSIAASKGENSRSTRASSMRSRSTSSDSTLKTTPKRAGKSATPHRTAIARAAQRECLLLLPPRPVLLRPPSSFLRPPSSFLLASSSFPFHLRPSTFLRPSSESPRCPLTAVRMRASRGQSSTSGSTLPTPLDSSASPEYVPEDDEEFEDSAFSDSPLSAPSDESDEAEASEEETKKPPKKKQKKTTGRRLDGKKADELPESWKHRSQEERIAELQRIKDEKALIQKMEAKLKKKLGRKLTQGERNQIRLGLVSLQCMARKANLSTTLSWSMPGATSRPTSSPSCPSPWRRTRRSSSPSSLSRRRACTG